MTHNGYFYATAVAGGMTVIGNTTQVVDSSGDIGEQKLLFVGLYWFSYSYPNDG